MDDLEQDLLADAEDDRLTVEYIKTRLPREVREKLTDDDLYYFLDVLGEYYSALVDKAGDGDTLDIDIDDAAAHLARQARKDRIGAFDPEDLRWVVDGELDYGEASDQG